MSTHITPFNKFLYSALFFLPVILVVRAISWPAIGYCNLEFSSLYYILYVLVILLWNRKNAIKPANAATPNKVANILSKMGYGMSLFIIAYVGALFFTAPFEHLAWFYKIVPIATLLVIMAYLLKRKVFNLYYIMGLLSLSLIASFGYKIEWSNFTIYQETVENFVRLLIVLLILLTVSDYLVRLKTTCRSNEAAI